MIRSRRSLVAAVSWAALVLSPSLSHAATTWVTTATQAVPVTKLLSAVDLGALPVSTPMTIRVALTLQNKAALLNVIKSGSSITPAQFNSTYAPTSAQVEVVTNYLQSAGFSDITVEPNNLLISASGTAQQAQSAFNTKLEEFSQFGKTVFGNTSAAEVPTALQGIVSAVLGLNTIGHMSSPLALPTAPQYLVSYTPKQFQTIYSAPSTTANKAAIAIMAEGDMTGVLSDLRIAEKAFGLPQAAVTVVTVGVPSTDTSGSDEWDLDTQYSTGIAGTVSHLYLYATTSLSDSDLALEFSRWVTDGWTKGASASLGECEAFPYIDGSMLVDDMIFLEAASEGKTFFASAGDTGSFCPVSVAGVNGVPAGAPLVNYPAASPYVIGVGGTTLLTNSNGTYDTETAWYAGGGGVSQFENATYWQKAANTIINETGFRGVPDIAYDADPNSGALVYVSGVAEGVGGTSLSSPLALGTWARVLSANNFAGFAGPKLYGIYDGATTPPTYPEGGFHDITVGANGLYTALPGYDFTTGLGTPIISQFVTDLSK